MAIVVALILGVLALAFVLYPLYRREPDAPRPTTEQDTSTPIVERREKEQSARAALQEVELDYQLGNISDNDYQSLREHYMQRALQALKSRYEREQELDQEIEEQLRKLKFQYPQADRESGSDQTVPRALPEEEYTSENQKGQLNEH